MIGIKNWKGFRIGDLFIIHPTKAYKLTNSKLLDGGGNPVVVNSAYNNGIGGYSTQSPTEKGNMVTFSDTVDANTIFYQSKDFIGYPHVQGLYPTQYVNNWNEYTYQFFVSVFRKVAITKGFDYGNKFRRDIASNLIVKLPITIDGQPDWAYMESYMKKIMEKSEKSLKNLKKSNCCNHLIDTRSWGKFCVRDFFKVLKGRSKLSITDINDGNVPVYSSNSKGGIFGYTTKQPDYLITKDTPLYITFGDHTKAINIAEQSFCVMDNVKVLTTELRNRNVLRFIITSWLKNIPNLGYARHWSKAEIAKIYLPITLNGQPDWTYMESYMKKVIDKSEQAISALRAVV